MQVARSLLAMICLFTAMASATTPAFSASTAEGQGLQSLPSNGSHWQGRLSLTSRTPSSWSASVSNSNFESGRVDSAFALADYYFSAAPGRERTSGFRASGGIGFARRGAAWLGRMPLGAGSPQTGSSIGSAAFTSEGEPNSQAMPYVGVGYSGIYPKSGWGFTADLGLMGLSSSYAGATGLNADGAGAAGPQSVDSQFNQMRMRPVLQVGVSYSF
jgi:hypothetical protein